MNLSEVLLSVVAAVATLTPLTLGLLNYFKDKKKDDAVPANIGAVATMGDTVDFESLAVASFQQQITMLDANCRDLNTRLTMAQSQRDSAYAQLRAAGIPIL